MLAVAAAAVVCGGWDGVVVREVAWRAVTFFPEDLARQVRRHHRRYDEGVRRGLGVPPSWRAGDPGKLDEALAQQLGTCRAMLRRPAPLDDLVEEIGVLAVRICDANDPLAVAHDDPREPRYASGWKRYGRSVLSRVRIVYYGQDAKLLRHGRVGAFLEEIPARARRLYPFIGEEFYRGGTLRDWRSIDDRSVAFGVAGVALSHAMTDLVNAATHVWVSGGGVMPTPRPTPPDHLGPTITVPLEGGYPDRLRRRDGAPMMPGRLRAAD